MLDAPSTAGFYDGVPDQLPEGVSVAIADEVEGYVSAIPGHRIEAIRTGSGFASSVVTSIRGDGYLAASGSVGFPVMGRTAIGDDQITAVSVTSAPPGSRWCEIDVEPGSVLIYGPGAEHHAVSPAGLRYSFAVTRRERLAELADQLGLDLLTPLQGQVHVLEPSTRASALGHTLSAVVEASVAGVVPDLNREDDLLHDLVAALSEKDVARRVGSDTKIDNRRVAYACIEYVKAVGRIPSIRELCLVAHVSERRLRAAFVEVYGTAPARFFRLWALDEARRQLVAADPERQSVTRIAVELGFGHLGRFASRYCETYGEFPSTTLSLPR